MGTSPCPDHPDGHMYESGCPTCPAPPDPEPVSEEEPIEHLMSRLDDGMGAAEDSETRVFRLRDVRTLVAELRQSRLADTEHEAWDVRLQRARARIAELEAELVVLNRECDVGAKVVEQEANQIATLTRERDEAIEGTTRRRS